MFWLAGEETAKSVATPLANGIRQLSNLIVRTELGPFQDGVELKDKGPSRSLFIVDASMPCEFVALWLNVVY